MFKHFSNIASFAFMLCIPWGCFAQYSLSLDSIIDKNSTGRQIIVIGEVHYEPSNIVAFNEIIDQITSDGDTCVVLLELGNSEIYLYQQVYSKNVYWDRIMDNLLYSEYSKYILNFMAQSSSPLILKGFDMEKHEMYTLGALQHFMLTGTNSSLRNTYLPIISEVFDTLKPKLVDQNWAPVFNQCLRIFEMLRSDSLLNQDERRMLDHFGYSFNQLYKYETYSFRNDGFIPDKFREESMFDGITEIMEDPGLARYDMIVITGSDHLSLYFGTENNNFPTISTRLKEYFQSHPTDAKFITLLYPFEFYKEEITGLKQIFGRNQSKKQFLRSNKFLYLKNPFNGRNVDYYRIGGID